MEPVEMNGFLWHAFPYSQFAKETQEPLALPHWSDKAVVADVEGVILLEDQGGWHRRVGPNGYLLLTEMPVPPTVPSGWLCKDPDLPDGWIGSDHRGTVEVISRGGPEDQSPVSGVRHSVRVRSRAADQN